MIVVAYMRVSRRMGGVLWDGDRTPVTQWERCVLVSGISLRGICMHFCSLSSLGLEAGGNRESVREESVSPRWRETESAWVCSVPLTRPTRATAPSILAKSFSFHAFLPRAVFRRRVNKIWIHALLSPPDCGLRDGRFLGGV